MSLNICVYKKQGNNFISKYDDECPNLIKKLNDRFLYLSYQNELLNILAGFKQDSFPLSEYSKYDGEYYYRPIIKKNDLEIIRQKLINNCGSNYRIFMVLIKLLIKNDIWLFYNA